MKSPILLPCIAAGIGLMASCYPIPDEPRQNANQQQQAQPELTSEERQRIEAQRERMRQEAERREQQQRQATSGQQQTQRETTSPPPTTPTQREDFPFATPVPGKTGFVFSPYNNQVVDVRDIASGTLVQDPTFPPAERKYFRVP